MGSVAQGHNKAQRAIGKANLSNRAAVENKPVLFDAVAEDDTVLGHFRDDLQGLVFRDGAVHNLCP